MATAQRLKGQEVKIAITQGGAVVNEINSIGSFNDSTDLELKEDGFLGEPVNRFDEVLNGFGGDFEIQMNTANWVLLQQAIIARARRDTPATQFNIIRTDFYANGETSIFSYLDVKWGAQPTTIGSRGDFVKVRMEFRCSERGVQTNALL